MDFTNAPLSSMTRGCESSIDDQSCGSREAKMKPKRQGKIYAVAFSVFAATNYSVLKQFRM